MTKDECKKRLDYFLQLRLHADEDSINHKMEMSLYAWDACSVILCFPVKPWQLNPMGQMHGGLLATAMDIAMGCVSYTFTDAKTTPTATMNLQYIRPVMEGTPLYVKAWIDHAGSRIAQVRAEGYQEEGKPCITASGSYMVNR